ncbi:hypothetical protein ACLOJK_028635 [Asimina triloba]
MSRTLPATSSSSAGGGRAWGSTTSVSASGKRIQKEMSEFNSNPPPDCSAGPKGDNLYQWISIIIGPPGILFFLLFFFFSSLLLGFRTWKIC